MDLHSGCLVRHRSWTGVMGLGLGLSLLLYIRYLLLFSSLPIILLVLFWPLHGNYIAIGLVHMDEIHEKTRFL